MSKKLLFNEVSQETDTDDVTRLQYLEGTGTQYINTEYIPTMNTKIELELLISTSSPYYGYFFGSDVFFKVSFTSSMSSFRGYKYGNRTDSLSTTSFRNNRCTFIIDMSNTSNFMQVLQDGVEIANYDFSYSTSQKSTQYPLHIFQGYTTSNVVDSTYTCVGKIYGCKIYESEELVRNFIPALDENNIPSLYDTITKNYYYNASTGNFNYEQ